jgi:HD-GYP domain-containing protein (c-di-GMP phosphodiesterase class II)
MVRTTILAACSHDIGKLGICNGVLNKLGRLSPAEVAVSGAEGPIGPAEAADCAR